MSPTFQRYLCVLLLLGNAIAAHAQTSADVSRLIETAKNTGATPTKRLEALEQAGNIDPLAAEEAAYSLVSDPNESVAVAAAKLLAAAIVMSNHPATDPSSLSVHQQAVMRHHMAAKEALYPALHDKRVPVRRVAAQVLSSLSDKRALASIDSGVQRGIYEDTEAVNYYGLANAAIGAKYMLPYLANGSVRAKQVAIQYLGRNTTYQDTVRREVLMDATEQASVRVTAASVLGGYDSAFPSYAEPLATSPDLPIELYAEVLGHFLDRRPDLSEAEVRKIRESLENYIQRAPQMRELEELEKRLEQLQPRGVIPR